MQKTGFLLLVLLAGSSLSAQSIKLPVGTKFSINTTTNITTKASAMGQEMEIGNTIINFFDFEIKAITNTGLTMTAITKRMKGSVNVMGADQSFDSDDEASKSNPQMAAAFDMLNKPYDIEIDNKKAVMKGEIGDKIAQMGVPALSNDQAKYILTQSEIAQLKEGGHWKDSVITDDNRIINEYSVIKTDDATAEIFVKTTLKMNITMKQMGMEMKEVLSGTFNAKRQYNKINGLLIREDNDMAMDGSVEVMGQNSPMSMKGTMITIVN